MDYKKLLYFAGGVVVGGIAGWFASKKHFTNELQEVIEEEMERRGAFDHEDYDDSEEDYGMGMASVSNAEDSEDDIFVDEESEAIREAREKIKINEQMKEEMHAKIFGDPEKIHRELAETLMKAKEAPVVESISWKNNTRKPEIISPDEFLNEQEDIVKAEDPLIYFSRDGVLINTEDDICEPFNDDFRKEYFNLDETIKHFGEWGEQNVLYLRCFEEPVTDYKIIRKEGTFKDSPWYPVSGIRS